MAEPLQTDHLSVNARLALLEIGHDVSFTEEEAATLGAFTEDAISECDISTPAEDDEQEGS